MTRTFPTALVLAAALACGAGIGCEKGNGGTTGVGGVSNGMPGGSASGGGNDPQTRGTGDVDPHPGTSAANVPPATTQPNPKTTMDVAH